MRPCVYLIRPAFCNVPATTATVVRGPEHHREKLMTEVWLFGGSAAAYVKAPSAEKLMSHWPE
jgi:hypothetical protein